MKICIIIFDQAGVRKVKKLLYRHLLDQVDILSITPGIDLAILEGSSSNTIPFESYSDNLSQLDISYDCTILIKWWTGVLNKQIPSPVTIGNKEFESLVSYLLNMSALLLHSPIMSMYALSHYFSTNRYDEVIFAKSPGVVYLPERPDVKFWYYPSLFLGPVCRSYFDTKCQKFREVYFREYRFCRIKSKIRHILIFFAKLGISIKRCLGDRKFRPRLTGFKKNVLSQKKKVILLIVRAQSEWCTIKHLYCKLMAHPDLTPVILQDDLLKNPSGRLALEADDVPFVPIHCVQGPWKLLYNTVKAFIGYKLYIRKVKIISKKEQGGIFNHQLKSSILQHQEYQCLLAQVINSVLTSTPELKNFIKNVCYFIKIFDASAIITMDMVDQWCAALMPAAKASGIPSFIMQNSCLDEIIYPLPVSADKIWLDSKWAKNILQMSETLPESLEVVGSPIYDDLYEKIQKYDKKSLRVKNGILEDQFVILVATQPFVQSYSYNETLLESLSIALSKESDNVVVIIKPHPRENSSLYKNAKNIFSCKVVVSESHDIAEMIMVSDLFISRTSTSIQTAILLNVPPIAYLQGYPRGICNRLKYLASDATTVVDSTAELSIAVNHYLRSNKCDDFHFARTQYIHRDMGYFDGQCSQRVVNSLMRGMG